MGLVHRLISTCLGIGYTPKGGGSLAAALCCIVWYFAWPGGNEHFRNGVFQVLVTAFILVIGAWSAGKMEREWGEDSYRIVIDEIAGMSLTLCFVPHRWQYMVIGFLLFRFFDIAKPLGIRKMEGLGGGWGVMMDDMLAGVYSSLLLQIVVLIKPW
ncbi:phosphatidylglycerophosphatase A family protein [Puia dinghuensis]|uniref:Phosphatidylglycerophosphatase A n=1 Tax=Puia dinghuensis TaxID=1792502 RepID=A0A8J2UC38_9BACT|nr:phosphatidylglycerophosphatase A [Puia dinghuensis]GGA97000.1 phosphatidylglycerophosphatase A [Puia dinghuensis]